MSSAADLTRTEAAQSDSAKRMKEEARSRECTATICGDRDWSSYVTLKNWTFPKLCRRDLNSKSITLCLKMGLPVHTTEKPSTSETKETVKATQNTSTPSTSSNTKSEAELAAEKLYEERMEEEFAKREGGA
ncbi:hypothetical protein EG327_007991 [Venturia inaequalis]|uniref:Uncharacterized protein n=1 Tax=Venturia inaequalis TaxID=5025 RepID=A0A8H3Z0R4_VENIN|nr:hypothetical protein EG327_007991 [Venturia inaequalis]